MTDMLNRVSEAIMAKARELTLDYDDYPASGLDYDELARAAIEALRDFDFASSDMKETYLMHSNGFGGFHPPWRELLDAALPPHKEM